MAKPTLLPNPTTLPTVAANPVKSTNPAQPNGNIIVLGDDGLFHVVSRATWTAAPVVSTTDASYPTLALLANNGVYLADLPDGIGGGIGEVCTLVNVQAIIAPAAAGNIAAPPAGGAQAPAVTGGGE
jgi:hypothetical protein